MQAAAGSLDGIIDTVSAIHPLLPLISLLKTHGKLVMVGAPEKPLELPAFPLLLGTFILESVLKFETGNIDNVGNRKEVSGGERYRRDKRDTRDGRLRGQA